MRKVLAVGLGIVAVTLADASITDHLAQAHASRSGLASWYGAWHEGKPMANGKPFRAAHLTAASRSIPLGTRVRVRNRRNNKTVVVVITDRGPYVSGRVIDLSRAAADALDMRAAGIASVELELLEAPTPPR